MMDYNYRPESEGILADTDVGAGENILRTWSFVTGGTAFACRTKLNGSELFLFGFLMDKIES
jgi:hypothetical protein